MDSRGACEPPVPMEEQVEVRNWSGTRSVVTDCLFTPVSPEQVLELVAWASAEGRKLRPVGSCLSPNGLAFQPRGMVAMRGLHRVCQVEGCRASPAPHSLVTVQAGALVSEVLSALREKGLTLANLGSIAEQQIGGWTQLSAHGTGARIPPVDEMVAGLRLATAGKGELLLGHEALDQEFFLWSRVGLGALGIVTELTLKCVPQYFLRERTWCSTREEVRRNHAAVLNAYRHARYMWIPYTDVVVVVVSDIVDEEDVEDEDARDDAAERSTGALQPLKDLLRAESPDTVVADKDGFADLRGKLLALNPLDAGLVARVNRAEADYWRASAGQRSGESSAILGFECGGPQWVLESCISCGSLCELSFADLDCMDELLQWIERENIPAPAPIEQRWTARSRSPLSPAFSRFEGDVFSWIGIIMYVTDHRSDARTALGAAFCRYAEAHADMTIARGGAFHWGKADLAFHQGERLESLRECVRRRFDVDRMVEIRKELDPGNIFGNELIDAFFPL